MKRIAALILFVFSLMSYGQFKDPGFPTSTVKDGITSNTSTGSFFGLFSSDNFRMNHSLNLSYSAFGSQGMALSVYTNSMFLDLADNLNVQVDASIVNSPYSSFGKDFQNSINGIYLSRAAINYRPWQDFSISVQYSSFPLYNSYYNGFNFFDRMYGDHLGY